MVDTVSGLGAELLSPEEWGLDVAIAGPQKCLGGHPGSLADVDQPGRLGGDGAAPEPAARLASSRSSTGKTPGWRGKRFPYTPSVTEMYALESTLTQTLEEGHGARSSSGIRRSPAPAARASKALGLELWPAREEIAASCVTAVKVPDGLDRRADPRHDAPPLRRR